jgi:L-glyceraldehyde 3-phosphate reductase
MRYRSVPATGRKLPVIGFGTGDNAGLMVAGQPDQQVAAVTRALELGIDYFDTSPDYGLGRAEENLGRALRAVRATPTLCSKVEVLPDDLDDVASAVQRSVEQSLRRLGVNRIDILMIHNGPAADRVLHTERWGALKVGDFLGPRGAIAGLEALQADDVVDVIGFTCARADAASVRELLDTGVFGMINVWYNLLNPSAGVTIPKRMVVDLDYEDIIDYAMERGVGVAAFRPLAGGALTGQATGHAGRHPLAGGFITRNPKGFEQDLARAQAVAEALGVDGQELTRLAYRFALDHPGVTTVLGGFSDITQLEEVAAIADLPELTDEDREVLRRLWQSNFDGHREVP